MVSWSYINMFFWREPAVHLKSRGCNRIEGTGASPHDILLSHMKHWFRANGRSIVPWMYVKSEVFSCLFMFILPEVLFPCLVIYVNPRLASKPGSHFTCLESSLWPQWLWVEKVFPVLGEMVALCNLLPLLSGSSGLLLSSYPYFQCCLCR